MPALADGPSEGVPLPLGAALESFELFALLLPEPTDGTMRGETAILKSRRLLSSLSQHVLKKQWS